MGTIIETIIPILFVILSIALLFVIGLYISFSKRTLYLNRKEVDTIIKENNVQYGSDYYRTLTGIIASRKELAVLSIALILGISVTGYITYRTTIVNSEEIKLAQEITYRLYTVSPLNLNKLGEKLESNFTKDAYYMVDPTNVYNIADRHMTYNKKNTSVKIINTYIKDNTVILQLEVVTDNTLYKIQTETTFNGSGKVVDYKDYLLQEIVNYD